MQRSPLPRSAQAEALQDSTDWEATAAALKAHPEIPGQIMQGEFGILGLQIDRQDDQESNGEDRRRARAGRQGGDVGAPGLLIKPDGEEGVPGAGGQV